MKVRGGRRREAGWDVVENEKDLTSIGKNLRKLRSERGLTQAELAGDAYTHAYVSTIEAGRRSPSRNALLYFADRLGVDPEELSTGRAAEWQVELAQELSIKGSDKKARELLGIALEILEQNHQLRPRALAVAHREFGKLEARRGDLAAAARHLRAAVEVLQRSKAPAAQLTETYMLLGDVLTRQRKATEAMKAYRAGCAAQVDAGGVYQS